jgi:hypothetical protein
VCVSVSVSVSVCVCLCLSVSLSLCLSLSVSFCVCLSLSLSLSLSVVCVCVCLCLRVRMCVVCVCVCPDASMCVSYRSGHRSSAVRSLSRTPAADSSLGSSSSKVYSSMREREIGRARGGVKGSEGQRERERERSDEGIACERERGECVRVWGTKRKQSRY